MRVLDDEDGGAGEDGTQHRPINADSVGASSVVVSALASASRRTCVPAVESARERVRGVPGGCRGGSHPRAEFLSRGADTHARCGGFPCRSPVHYGCLNSLTDAQVQNDDIDVNGHGEHSPRENGDHFSKAAHAITCTDGRRKESERLVDFSESWGHHESGDAGCANTRRRLTNTPGYTEAWLR